MELLILGFDGGDPDIIKCMDMPCLQSLLAERELLPIKEDLWSRGWAEIVSGKHGRETNAFYQRPVLDGTYKFTQSYKTTDYAKAGCVPIWDAISKTGRKVGFLNLPTTIPAPQVEGFFVSGAGGGFSPAGRVPELACHPPEIQSLLLRERFIWENRFKVSGVRNFDCYIDRCIQAIVTRTKVFTNLSKAHKVDVGFFVQKEVTLLQNIFMHELNPLIKNKAKDLNPIQRRLMEFFRVLDDFISILIEDLQPEHIMVVSDHAQKPYLYSYNINSFLKEAGFLQKEKSNSNKIKKKLKEIKNNFFQPLQQKEKAKSLMIGWSDFGNIDYAQSYAFGNRYIPGIYINDQERFSGKVKSSEKAKLVQEIIESFNSLELSKKFRIKAMPYREKFADAHAERSLPDIWLDHPDTMYPEGKGEFIQNNPYYQSFPDLEYLSRDVLTGLKGRNAILSVEEEMVGNLDTDSSKYCDLSAAYQIILNHLKK